MIFKLSNFKLVETKGLAQVLGALDLVAMEVEKNSKEEKDLDSDDDSYDDSKDHLDHSRLSVIQLNQFFTSCPNVRSIFTYVDECTPL